MMRIISCSSAAGKLMSIFLTLNLILFVHSQSIEYWDTPLPYDVLPANSLLYVRETLKLQCKINNDGTKSSDLFMKFEHKSGAVWNETTLNTTDEKIAWIELNITDAYAPHTSVYCINKKTGEKRDNLLYVERPIINVVNIKGIYFYGDALNVTWGLGEEYFDLNNIKVETTWLNLPNPNENYSLGCTEYDKESCIIKQSVNVTLHDFIFFKIKVCSVNSNKRPPQEYLLPLSEPCSETIQTFNLKNITKTGPPLNLTITNRSSTCLSLTWINSSYMEYCTFCEHIYQIDLREEWEDDSQFRKILNSTDQVYPHKYVAVDVCNLNPLTTYVLRLQIKGYEFQPWSDPREIRASTNEDRPLTGPSILNTSYYEENCVNNKKQVTVYWKDMDSNTLRGILTNYELSVSNQNITLRPGTNNFKTEVNCSQDSVIQIYAVTKVGQSLTPSEIHIPSDEGTLASPSGINLTVEEYVSGNNSKGIKDVTIRWNANSDRAGDLKLLFYMCHEYYQPKLCLDDYMFREVNFSDEKLILTQIDVGTSLFGYALGQVNGRKRGIVWTDCVFQADGYPA